MTDTITAEDIEAAFAAAGAARSNKKCATGNLIEEHPALEPKIMDVEHYSATFISKVLGNLGLYLADSTITKHRKGECRCCPKETS